MTDATEEEPGVGRRRQEGQKARVIALAKTSTLSQRQIAEKLGTSRGYVKHVIDAAKLRGEL